MKKIIITIIALILFIPTAKAEEVYSIKNPTNLCNSVKNNTLKIFVYDYYKNKDFEVGKVANSCSNTEYYNNNLKTKKRNDTFTPWTWHGRSSSTTTYYIENNQKSKTDYQYFAISNGSIGYSSDGTLSRTKTLTPGEKIYFTVDLADKKFASNKYKDVRITIDYAHFSGDNTIIPRNTMGIYIIGSDNKTYGPYRIGDYSIKEVVSNVSETGATSKSITYRIVSENVLKDVPTNIEINTIKIVPYDFYNVRGGMFKFYSFSVSGYSSSYSNSKPTVALSDADLKIRQTITDNMLNISTLKWRVASNNTTKLYFYHHFNSSNPQEFNGTNGNVYYGIPYVNTYDSTIESFLDNASKTKDNNNKVVYDYILPKKYTTTKTSTIGNTITAGNSIKNNKLYVYESNSSNDEKKPRKTQLATYDYIPNNNYFYGLDCSSSTYLAEGMAIPIVYSMAASNRYLSSAEVDFLGDVTLDIKNMEEYLRSKNIVKNDENLTEDNITSYYTQYFKKVNSAQKIYESYALAVPGDIIAKRGHVRMETGYPYVVCKDGTSTKKYTKGFCNNHNGINPEKSYVITTEIGGTYGKQKDKKFTHNGVKNVQRSETFAKKSETGWTFNLNGSYTDLTNVDDFLNINANFIVNNKYSFKDLYGKDKTSEVTSESGMYMAFRYRTMSTPISNKVEIPTVNLTNQSTSETISGTKRLTGSIITNYIIQEIKYEVNGTTYHVYPRQTNTFSLYNDTPANIQQAISNADADNLKIKVSIKQGPNIRSVQDAASADSNNYKLILNLDTTGVHAAEPPRPPEDEDDPSEPEEDRTEPEIDPVEERDDEDVDVDEGVLGEDQTHQEESSQGESEQEKNPGTGAFIKIRSIIFLIILFVLAFINNPRFKKIYKV